MGPISEEAKLQMEQHPIGRHFKYQIATPEDLENDPVLVTPKEAPVGVVQESRPKAKRKVRKEN